MLPRLKRLLLTLAVLIAVTFGLCFAVLVLMIAIGVAFSASSGQQAQSAMRGLDPFVHAIVGAVTFGGVVALINAVVAERGIWILVILIVSILGAVVFALNPPLGKAMMGLTVPVFSILAKVFLYK